MDPQSPRDNSSPPVCVAELSNSDEVYSTNTLSPSKATRQSFTKAVEHPLQTPRRLTSHTNSSTPVRKATRYQRSLSFQSLISAITANTTTNNMSDGKNEARALRVLEIMNDFRTLQVHITSLVTRAEASPPDQASYYLDGYVVLRQCNAEAQAILATHYNPGNIGLEPGRIPDTEVQKATLQRIILDASTRRFSAHKIYLRAAAGMRWIQLRQQASGGGLSPGKKAQALQAIDARLREELSNITDESVVNDLRAADGRKNYWLDEDPTLERMLAWIRRQR